MDWDFVARDYNLDSETDFKRNVSTKMCNDDKAYPLFNKEKTEYVGWLIIKANTNLHYY